MNIVPKIVYNTREEMFDRTCPYNGINVCMASFSSRLIDNQKKANYCNTDNYDNCPIFLSKVLRKG